MSKMDDMNDKVKQEMSDRIKEMNEEIQMLYSMNDKQKRTVEFYEDRIRQLENTIKYGENSISKKIVDGIENILYDAQAEYSIYEAQKEDKQKEEFYNIVKSIMSPDIKEKNDDK